MNEQQLDLHLPAPPSDGSRPLIPARMVNEFVYCPRLAYLMWTNSEWAETADTLSGREVHKRVDKPGAPLPDPALLDQEPASDRIISRSLTLSSERLGVIAKLDIAEAEGGSVTPIDYKRGKRPHVARGLHDPERVQLCLQAMLLEEHGYRVAKAAIYYAESREKVWVEIDDDLRAATREAVNQLRLTVVQGRLPPPLADSPKCPRCALVTICLPDEVRALSGADIAPRPIAVPTTDALPLIVQSHGARIAKEGETLRITEVDGQETRVRLGEICDLALFGNVSVTTPALSALMEREIPITFLSNSGWFKGLAQGIGHRNVEVRTAQYRASFDPAMCLRFARELVRAKITNQRTMLRRNWQDDPEQKANALGRLAAIRRSVSRAQSMDQLLGLEGEAAAVYFRGFAALLRPPPDKSGDGDFANAFRFDARNRRPPADPVNAMLSLAYAMLTRHLTIALASVGFDPFRGLYHQPRFGRPSLALDLMEPFRPLIADSVVLSVVNTGQISKRDFVMAATGTALTQAGRRRFVQAFERRLSQETTHPVLGYRLSMRRLLILQARLLSRFLLGEIPAYPHYLPR